MTYHQTVKGVKQRVPLEEEELKVKGVIQRVPLEEEELKVSDYPFMVSSNVS
jgi:hypothetical protein